MPWKMSTREKLKHEARLSGLRLLSQPDKDCSVVGRYKLPCGHVKDMQTGSVRRGCWECDCCPPDVKLEQYRYRQELAKNIYDAKAKLQGATLLHGAQ
jgi:hypothetical protein